MTTHDIKLAMRMAAQYAKFAPGKLIPKDMAADGDKTYDVLSEMDAIGQFLFPQLDAVERLSVVSLAAVSDKIKSGNATDFEYQTHQAEFTRYKASGIENKLTPFQVELVKQEFAPRE
jgi:hypothetical protein